MKAFLARFWPRSLVAQLLLAAALALLVAQIVNAALLLKGLRSRAELEASTLVIGAISAREESALGRRALDRRQAPRPPRRRSVAFVLSGSSPVPPSFAQNDTLTERAAGFLGGEWTAAPSITMGPTADLPENLRRRLLNGRLLRRMMRDGLPPPRRALMFSARQADGRWLGAVTLIRPVERGSITALILQTVLLYVTVLLALVLVARRVSRPLSDLKSGMTKFGRDTNAAPLPENGPSDIRELVRAYNGMQQKVASLLSEKDVMLGAIGHDLKTPLASLRVRIESVEDEAEREQMAASIEEISAMLDDILMLARLGRSGEKLERVDVAALVDMVADDFPGESEKIKIKRPSDRIVAQIRPMLVRRALRNLIANALRYAGNASISIDRAGQGVAIIVEDDGPGIEDGLLDRAFEPFERGDDSRNRASGGSGLGLTIARAIARSHGGDLTIQNRRDASGLRATLSIDG